MSPASDAPPATRTLAGESDWLNSQPVFYNVRTGAVSEAINEVVDLSELEFDPDGLTDYLAAGYCLFERTPVRDVRFLPPNTRLWRDGAGRLELERLPDPAPAYLGAEPDEEAIIERLHVSGRGVAGGPRQARRHPHQRRLRLPHAQHAGRGPQSRARLLLRPHRAPPCVLRDQARPDALGAPRHALGVRRAGGLPPLPAAVGRGVRACRPQPWHVPLRVLREGRGA